MNIKNDTLPNPIAVKAARLFCLAVSKLVWRIEFHGVENVPNDLQGGLLVAPNHQTYADPFWIALKIKRDLRFMAWDKVFGWFFVGAMIKTLGAFPVKLEGTGIIRAMKQAIKLLRDGATLMIFPEGERAFPDGKMHEFKPGAVRIALEAGIPILPVTVRGGNKIWAQGMKRPRFGKVEIFYHPLFEITPPPEGVEMDAHVEILNAELKRIIASKL